MVCQKKKLWLLPVWYLIFELPYYHTTERLLPIREIVKVPQASGANSKIQYRTVKVKCNGMISYAYSVM
jgi:hypothetical protein